MSAEQLPADYRARARRAALMIHLRDILAAAPIGRSPPRDRRGERRKSAARKAVAVVAASIALAGCIKRHTEPTVTFRKAACLTKPLNETRTRQVASHCLMHSRYYSAATKTYMTGACIVWSYRTVHDRMYNESCSHDYWSRDLER
jgi:hypothetical protein